PGLAGGGDVRLDDRRAAFGPAARNRAARLRRPRLRPQPRDRHLRRVLWPPLPRHRKRAHLARERLAAAGDGGRAGRAPLLRALLPAPAPGRWHAPRRGAPPPDPAVAHPPRTPSPV